MLSLIAVKKRFLGQSLTAIRTSVCSRFYHLTAPWADTQLFHHVWSKAKAFQISKPNLLRH